MSTRGEALLWVAQRASAAVLALAVSVHLATMIVAVRGGLSAAEILGRLHANPAWLVFYVVFVLAVAVHAPLGVRTILIENTPLGRRASDVAAGALAIVLLALGFRAILGLFGYAGG